MVAVYNSKRYVATIIVCIVAIHNELLVGRNHPDKNRKYHNTDHGSSKRRPVHCAAKRAGCLCDRNKAAPTDNKNAPRRLRYQCLTIMPYTLRRSSN